MEGPWLPGSPPTDSNARRAALKQIFKALGLVLLVYIAYRMVDFQEFVTTLSSLSIGTTLALLALATIDRLLMIVKWQHLCRAIHIPVRFRDILASYYAGSFLCYFLPTTLGGDLYRGYRVSRAAPTSGVIASMAMEKVIGAFATITFAWVGLLYLILAGIAPGSKGVFQALLAVSGVAVVVFLLSLNSRVHRLLLKPLQRWKLSGKLGKLSAAYSQYASHKGALAANLVLSMVESFVQILLVFGTALALGLEVPPLAFFAIITISEFVRRTSMVLDGWGLAESLRILIYGLVGLSAGNTLAIGIVSHAIVALASLPGAWVFFTDPSRHCAPREPKKESKVALIARRFLMPQFVVSLLYMAKARTFISFRAEVEPSDHLQFGRGCTVSSFTKIKSSGGPLKIGAKSGFATGCFVSSGEKGIEIGENLLCGPNVAIIGINYRHGEVDIPFEEQGLTSKGIKIGKNVWIGANSVISDGAVIGDNSIVVAGSLVNRRYPPNVIIQGSPAKVIFKRGRAPRSDSACVKESSISSRPQSAISTKS